MRLAELVTRATPTYKVVPVVIARLPAPISANLYWRSRAVILPGKAGARVQTYVSKEALAFKESVGWLLRQQGVRGAIKGRVQVDIRLLPHCPKDWKKRAKADPLYWADSVARQDADNICKVLVDALKGIALDDDKQVWRLYSEVMEPMDGEDECVIVQVSSLVRETAQEGLL